MKALRPALALIILSMLVSMPGMAQKTNYITPGGLTIGIGGGWSYQKSDLTNSKGFGFDFNLGSQLYHKENAFLSVGWKFRFLAGQNKAYDHRINPDNTYSNIRYNFYNFDLELDLTLNRLRERTGIVLTGFVGAGMTYGITATDLYDAGNNLYDYSSIDPNQDSKSIYNDLVALSDGDFETSLVSKAALLPTAGLFLGYQLSRSLMIGVEYKTNFYLTEENGAFGIDLDNKAISGSGLDRNNYVSAGIRWAIGGGGSSKGGATSSSYQVTGNNNTTVTNTHVVTASSSHPSVHITEPSADPYQASSSNQTIRATINNVSGPENISFFQNGYPVNIFTYNVDTKTFMASIRLREGENSVRITAANQGSTAEDQAVISLENPTAGATSAPTVEFTSPRGDQVTTSSDWIDVTSSVKNISSKEDIQLLLNGNNTPFDFYPVSGMVKTSVTLVKGVNHMFIKGSNESGSAEDQLDIHFTDPEKIASPTVHFINPSTPVEVGDKRFPLSAETQNVRGRNDVGVRMNGTSIHNFAFDAEGRISVSLFLPEGVSTVEVTARNESGSASESTYITYYAPVVHEVVYQQPIYQEPIYQEPIYQEPIYQEPVVREPVTREPVYQDPVTREPVNQNPATRDPVNQDPVTRDPVNQEPANRVPVTRLTPPVIKIFSPYTNPFRTQDQTGDLHATVLHVNSKENIALYLNGMNFRDFNFSQNTNSLTARLALREGENTLTIKAQNRAGEDMKEQIFIKESKPCLTPVIKLIDPVQGQSSTNQQTCTLRAEVRNIANPNQLKLMANGNSVSFNFRNNVVQTSITLNEGLNTISLTASNECGEDHVSTRISYNPNVVIDPCTPPTVSFTLHEVNRNDASHELRGSVSGVKNKADISITLDGRANSGFQFSPATGELSAKFKLTPGAHRVVVSVKNTCGTDTKSESVTFKVEDDEEEENEDCGIRINPGNSSWQFCLVTPSGTYNRDDLSNSNFSYSGRASSIYFMPIGGGGTATVNGKSYTIKSGQYYLFTGSLNVSVSTKNPGSMGHWSVCISAGNAPVSGNGNNRPKSPCETKDNGKLKGTSANTGTGSGSGNATNTRTNYRTNNGYVNRTNTRSNGSTSSGTISRTTYKPDDNTVNRTNTRSSTRSTSGSNNKTSSSTSRRDKDLSIDSTDKKTEKKTDNRTGSRTKR